MKRLSNLFDKICTIENIEEADRKARKNKGIRYGILKHDLHPEKDNAELLESLLNGTYKTSKYSTFKIYEPKERLIYRNRCKHLFYSDFFILFFAYLSLYSIIFCIFATYL